MPGAWAPSTSASTPRDWSSRTSALDREDEPGRARHVVDQRQPRPGLDPRQHRLDDLLRRRHRERQGRHDDARARAGRHGLQRVPAGVVGVVGGEQLVPRPEVERPEHRVGAGRGVRDEGEVVRVRADERRRARLAPRPGAPPGPGPGTAPAPLSSRSRSRLCASSTARGQAPNEPWFRKVTSGSSGQSRRQPLPAGGNVAMARHRGSAGPARQPAPGESAARGDPSGRNPRSPVGVLRKRPGRAATARNASGGALPCDGLERDGKMARNRRSGGESPSDCRLHAGFRGHHPDR